MFTVVAVVRLILMISIDKCYLHYKEMSSIVYGGLRYVQIRHAIYCKNCFDTIESKDSRDFKYCSCRSIGIDGGISSGNRIIGDITAIENRSMYCAIVQEKRIWLPEFAINCQ
jgi:hypothetical protein